jgi:hypothetical protein
MEMGDAKKSWPKSNRRSRLHHASLTSCAIAFAHQCCFPSPCLDVQEVAMDVMAPSASSALEDVAAAKVSLSSADVFLYSMKRQREEPLRVMLASVCL